MTSNNLFKITFDKYEEVTEHMEYNEYIIYEIETRLRLLFNNIKEKNNTMKLNIKNIYVNVDYIDRLKWQTKYNPNYIFYRNDNKIIKKEIHPDLITNTFFCFKIPTNVNKQDYMSYINLIDEYVYYVKELEFCEIYSYSSIEITEDKIVIYMDAELG
jgi:hypothetical protein